LLRWIEPKLLSTVPPVRGRHSHTQAQQAAESAQCMSVDERAIEFVVCQCLRAEWSALTADSMPNCTHLSSRVMPAHGPNRVSRSNARSTRSSWLTSPGTGNERTTPRCAGEHGHLLLLWPQTRQPPHTRATGRQHWRHAPSVTASGPVTLGCSLLASFLLPPLLLRSTPAFRCLKWSVTRAVAISLCFGWAWLAARKVAKVSTAVLQLLAGRRRSLAVLDSNESWDENNNKVGAEYAAFLSQQKQLPTVPGPSGEPQEPQNDNNRPTVAYLCPLR
jgi:hypothetical protein